MLHFTETDQGLLLSVKAHAGARKNGILGIRQGALRVAVTEAPEKGKANKAILAILAKELKIRKSAITLVAGSSSSQKKFLISDLTPQRLLAWCGEKWP